MNKQRLKDLLKIKTELEKLHDEIDGLAMEEQEAFDNLPDSLQDSSDMEENVESLDEAVQNLDDAIGSLDGFDFDSIKTKTQLKEEARTRIKEIAIVLK